MAFAHGKDTTVLGGGYELSQYLNSSDHSGDIDTGEVTTFKKESKEYIAGLSDGQLTLAGLFDPTNEAALDALEAAEGVWSIGIDGYALGDRIRSAVALITSRSISAPVGDVVSIADTVQADGGVDLGIALADPEDQETAAGSSLGYDASALSSNGGVGILHLVEFNGTSIAMKIQHSTTDASYVDLATFASKSAIGSEAVVIAEGTTVNRWLRATWTGTFTTATFGVAFSRR